MTTFELYLCSKSKNPGIDEDEVLSSYLIEVPGNYNPDTDGLTMPYLMNRLTIAEAKKLKEHLIQPGWAYHTSDQYILVEAKHTEKFTLNGLNNAIEAINEKYLKETLEKHLQNARQAFYNETREWITPELSQTICDFFNEKDGLNLTHTYNL